MGLPKRRADDEMESIYRLDTIPPPDGEEDAYSAATKVGPLSITQLADLMRSTEEAPPQSGIQVCRSEVTVDPVAFEIDIAHLELIKWREPAPLQHVAPAPAAVPASPAPLAPAPIAMPAAAPQRARSSAALVIAILIPTLAIFAIGAWMFAVGFLNY